MSNEEFQKSVLEELRSLKNDMSGLKEGQRNLEEGQKRLEGRQVKLEKIMEKIDKRQDGFEKKLDAVYEQTAQLVEFRNEVNLKLDNIIEDNKSIHEILGEHEISIRTLRRRPV